MSGKDSGGEGPGKGGFGEFTIEDFHEFREASNRFYAATTEMMAASVRVQMLMLDDAKLTLTEVADGFSGAIRKQRMSDETFI